MSTISVPLSKLVLSPLNVRQTTASDDTHDLEASILAHGLLAPLTVHPMTKGKYGVIAGGRRLRAMQALVEQRKLEAAMLIDVSVRDEDTAMATEISVVENTARVSLPPATEYAAFARLAKEGDDVSEIARRFATTELHVRQRMRLGQLHPAILAELDSGRISLDIAKAYAVTVDQDLQKRVFDQRHAHIFEIRAALKRDLVNAGVDRMIKLVGVAAYTAAGGAAEEDLFTPGEVRIADVDLLRSLFDAKLAAERAEIDLPDNVTLQFGYDGVGVSVDVSAEETPEIRDRRRAIDDRYDQILDRLDEISDVDVDGPTVKRVALAGENKDEVDRLVAEQERLATESEQLIEASTYPDGPLIAVAAIGDGKLEVQRFFRPLGWRPAGIGMVSAADGVPAQTAGEEREKPVISGFRSDRQAYSGVYQQPEAVAKAEHGLSKDAMEVMRSHHRLTLSAAILAEPIGQKLGGKFLIFVLARGMLRKGGNDDAATLGVDRIPLYDYDPAIAREDLAGQPGAETIHDAFDRVQAMDWMVEPDADVAFRRFTVSSFIDQERAAACVAVRMLSRSLNIPGFRVPVHATIAELLNVDDLAVREHWTPDERFFERLPKGRRMDAIRDVDADAAKRLGNLGNAELTAAAAEIMSGTRDAADKYGLSPWGQIRSRNWVPGYLSFADQDPPTDDDDEPASAVAFEQQDVAA